MLIFQAQEEEAMGLGVKHMEQATVNVEVCVKEAFLRASVDPLFVTMLPVIHEMEHIYVEWHEASSAYAEVLHAGSGVRSEGRAWNPTGLEGTWQMDYQLTIEFGSLAGSGTFTMPPRPEDGPWRSSPYDYTISGVFVVDDVQIDITIKYEGIVIIRCIEKAPHLDGEGTYDYRAVITGPDVSFTIETLLPTEWVPVPILAD